MSASAADGKKLKGSENATGRKARKASSAVLLSMPEGNWWGKESRALQITGQEVEDPV